MQRFVLRYPGDPPVEVLKLTRAEFLELHPRHPVVIEEYDESGVYTREEIPMTEDEIICDFCNSDPGDVIYTYMGVKGYCEDCAREHWLPYCEEK